MPKGTYLGTLLKTLRQPSRYTPRLYRLQLIVPTVSGWDTTYYFADADTDITATVPATPISSAGTFVFRAIGINRETSKTNAQLAVDEMLVAVPNRPITFLGYRRKVGELALSGVFDRAVVDVFLYDGANPGQVCGLHSSWIIQNATNRGDAVTFQLQSRWAQLKRQTPGRVFQAGCNWPLFSAGCGLLKTDYTTVATVLVGSTTTAVQFTITGTDMNGRAKGSSTYYPLGQMVGTSGVNVGLVRVIHAQAQSGTTATLTPKSPLPYTPNAGDTFNLVPGCDHSITTCALFDNVRGQLVNGVRCGGFDGAPDIPPVELTFLTEPVAGGGSKK